MIRGFDLFKKYFGDYPVNYTIRGGAACDLITDQAGFVPRATKGNDILSAQKVLNQIIKSFELAGKR